MVPFSSLLFQFEQPKVWKKQIIENLGSLKRYVDYIKEGEEFEEYKKKMKAELHGVIDQAAEPAKDINSLSVRLGDALEHLSKGMIFDTGVDPSHLLKHSNKITLGKKLQPWCNQLNMNVNHIVNDGYGIMGLINKFKGVPAIVVLAGPSLKNNRDELKRIGNKAIIIAVDTSFRPLLDIGVEPHIVVAHDANHNGAKFFLPKDFFPETSLNDLKEQELMMAVEQLKQQKPEILKKWNYKTLACFVNYISPLTIQSYCGDMVSFYSVFDPSLPVYQTMAHATNWNVTKDGKMLAHDKGGILGGSSVGHVAFYLAHAMGCNPITFTGMDLSYPNNLTYVEGSSNQKDMSKIKLVDVLDLSNRPVKTNISMFSYRTVFQAMLPQLIAQSNISVYNSTEHEDGSPTGILEVGAEPKRLKHFIDEFCTKDIPEVSNIRELVKKDRDGVN